MDLNQLIQKIPRPVLVLAVLIGAIIIFVNNDPLKDECEVQTALFEKKTQGLLTKVKVSGKTQYPQMDFWKDRCRQGNSIGSCDDYFLGVAGLIKELREVHDNCQVKYAESNDKFVVQIRDALQVMALVAWGQKPPAGVAERLGWLTVSQVRSFCYMKKTFILLAGEESFNNLREQVYRQYPGEWPDQYDFNKLIDSESQPVPGAKDKDKPEKSEAEKEEEMRRLIDENRPRALKAASSDPTGLTKEQIYERSLFSIRCDLYM